MGCKSNVATLDILQPCVKDASDPTIACFMSKATVVHDNENIVITHLTLHLYELIYSI